MWLLTAIRFIKPASAYVVRRLLSKLNFASHVRRCELKVELLSNPCISSQLFMCESAVSDGYIAVESFRSAWSQLTAIDIDSPATTICLIELTTLHANEWKRFAAIIIIDDSCHNQRIVSNVANERSPLNTSIRLMRIFSHSNVHWPETRAIANCSTSHIISISVATFMGVAREYLMNTFVASSLNGMLFACSSLPIGSIDLPRVRHTCTWWTKTIRIIIWENGFPTNIFINDNGHSCERVQAATTRYDFA